MSDRRPAVIRTEGLTKRFGPITAVDGIDLDVREGDVYGFLGANGSGKTTTVRMLLGLVLATSGTDRAARRGDAARPRGGCCRRSARWSRGRRRTRTCRGARNLALFDAMGAGRRPAHPTRPGRPRRSSRSGSPAWTSGRSGRTRSACGSGSAWPAPCCGSPGCWCSTSRPTASTRRASSEIRELLLDLNRAGHHGLPLQPPARRGRAAVHPRRRPRPRPAGAAGRARRAAPPTGRVEVHTPDVEQVRGAARRASSRSTTAQRLLVRDADPAALNARLVQAGIRVTRLGAERRTLEEVVLAATTASADRFGPA